MATVIVISIIILNCDFINTYGRDSGVAYGASRLHVPERHQNFRHATGPSLTYDYGPEFLVFKVRHCDCEVEEIEQAFNEHGYFDSCLLKRFCRPTAQPDICDCDACVWLCVWALV